MRCDVGKAIYFCLCARFVDEETAGLFVMMKEEEKQRNKHRDAV